MTSDKERVLKEYTAKELRKLAVGMPHGSEAKKAELVDWLLEYHPERIAVTPSDEELREQHDSYVEDNLDQDETSPEVKKVVDAVGSTLDEVIGKARLRGVPALLGTCTVTLHFELEDASTPLEAVQDVTNQIMRSGLTSWTWLVRDEITDEVYAVQDGRLIDLEEARVAPAD